MPRRGVISSALCNFLGTYTSRYSEFNNYWLFGFLVADGLRLEFDLLAPPPVENGLPQARAASLAIKRFHDQMSKAGIANAIVAAKLVLETKPGKVHQTVENHLREGYSLVVSVHVLIAGAWRQRETTLFVAPFDHTWQRASGRP